MMSLLPSNQPAAINRPFTHIHSQLALVLSYPQDGSCCSTGSKLLHNGPELLVKLGSIMIDSVALTHACSSMHAPAAAGSAWRYVLCTIK